MSERDTDTLLKLLYDEDVEGAQRERLLADEELSSELEGYRGLRELFREMPEEEPPEAVSQKLLHAAAQEAPKPKAAEAAGEEGEGFLARLLGLFRPIAAHPALAAAASLLLVAGVYGTMRVTGKDEVAQPEVRSAAEREERRPGARATSEAPPAADDLEAAEAPGPAEEDEATDREARGGEGAPEPADLREEKKPRRPAETRSGRRDRANEAERKKRRRRTRGRAKQDVIPDSAADDDRSGAAGGALRGGGGAGPGYGDRKESAPAQEQAPAKKAPPPAAKPAPEADADAPAEQEKSERQRDEARARRLHKKALAAAKNDQCGDVRDLADEVRAADGTYYDRVFLEDDRLRRCLR